MPKPEDLPKPSRKNSNEIDPVADMNTTKIISVDTLSTEENTEYDKYLKDATFQDLQEMADILGVAYQDHCHATELQVLNDWLSYLIWISN